MRRTEGFPRARRGFLIYLVLFIIIVLAVLTIHFHRLSRHSQAMAFHFEQSDVVRFMAEAALEEAFGFFWRQTANPGSPEIAWLLSHSSAPLNVPVPLTLKQAPAFTRSMFTPTISITATQIPDFRDQDSKGAKYYRYPKSGAPVEGVGTLEFTAKVRLTSAGSPAKQQASCVYVRHHDYKIVSVITQRNNTTARDQYSHSALLDYAFFVRKGYREFEDQVASPLNQTRVKIVIDQSAHPQNRLGKVFFGGTQKPGQFVFLNVFDEQKSIIPPLNAQETQRIQYLDVLELFPRLKKALDENKPDPIPYAELNGLEGVFVSSNVPAKRTTYPSGKLGELEKMTSEALISLAAGSARNIEPQQEILCTAKLGDAAYADTMFEGAIRQRFLHFIHYYLDATKLNPDAAKILAQEDYKMPCIPNPPNPPGDQDVKDFLSKLPTIAAKFATADKPLISCFQTDFLLKAGLAWPGGKATTSFPNPTFFNKAGNPVADPEDIGADGIQPYFHVNLWGRRMSGMNDLEEQGIVDYKANEIRPRGVEWVNGDLIIGKGSPLTIKGQGVLIANGNIQIDSNLVKASADDFLVLCTRKGQIIVKAGTVEASLIAVGTTGTGCITPTVPLNLKGAFAAERLNLNGWAGGTHTFKYDPVLMGGQDRYTVHLSPAITFQRITEQE